MWITNRVLTTRPQAERINIIGENVFRIQYNTIRLERLNPKVKSVNNYICTITKKTKEWDPRIGSFRSATKRI